MLEFGIHALVLLNQWTTESGNYAIAKAGELGFDVIEIPLTKPAEFNAESHREALIDAGMDAVCSVTLPRELHLPHYPDGARAYLLSLLDVVERLESTTLVGALAYASGVLTGEPPRPEERQIVVEVLRDVAAYADRRGIRLLLEARNRYETYLYNTLADVRETVIAVGARNLRLHADTYHMNIEEESFAHPFQQCADVLGYLHLSESHRGLLGSGTVNWEDVFTGLARANYSGVLTLESFAAISPDRLIPTYIWHPPKQPPEVIAREGLKFMRGYARTYALG